MLESKNVLEKRALFQWSLPVPSSPPRPERWCELMTTYMITYDLNATGQNMMGLSKQLKIVLYYTVAIGNLVG